MTRRKKSGSGAEAATGKNTDGGKSGPGAAAATMTVAIEVPLRRTGLYATNRVDVTLRPSQAEALRLAFDGLHGRHAVLADGTHVDGPPDVIRWLLEQIAKEMTISD